MANLEILLFPDPRLKLIAKPVEQMDDKIKQIAADMFETMYTYRGIGLAAIQVNIQKRIITMDLSENKKEPICLINPIFIEKKGSVKNEEGCLSFPKVYTKVKRAETVTIEYQDLEGKKQTLTTDGLLSVCIQHEIDHLDGITFYDRISPLRRTFLKKKIAEIEKH